MTITAVGGWCAPSQVSYEIPGVRPERWPAGLTEGDRWWLAAMMWAGGIEPIDDLRMELPTFGVSRLGVDWNAPLVSVGGHAQIDDGWDEDDWYWDRE